jgi:hypothetical protein
LTPIDEPGKSPREQKREKPDDEEENEEESELSPKGRALHSVLSFNLWLLLVAQSVTFSHSS